MREGGGGCADAFRVRVCMVVCVYNPHPTYNSPDFAINSVQHSFNLLELNLSNSLIDKRLCCFA